MSSKSLVRGPAALVFAALSSGFAAGAASPQTVSDQAAAAPASQGLGVLEEVLITARKQE